LHAKQEHHALFLPKKVFGAEVVARAIFSPVHVSSKGGKLKPAAFQPARETDEISTMRATFLGCNRCKRKARDIETPSAGRIYQGFAVVYARGVRSTGCEVFDSRAEFLGHADIRTGIACPPRGVPMEPEMREKSNEISSRLVALSRYIKDPLPEGSGWAGPALMPQQ
jgi:hypothetical protein